MKFFLFPDDTNIYFESDDLLKNEKTVNCLSLNVSKTNYIIFHPYNKPLRHGTTKIPGCLILNQREN